LKLNSKLILAAHALLVVGAVRKAGPGDSEGFQMSSKVSWKKVAVRVPANPSCWLAAADPVSCTVYHAVCWEVLDCLDPVLMGQYLTFKLKVL
jgi:hypothetical protein